MRPPIVACGWVSEEGVAQITHRPARVGGRGRAGGRGISGSGRGYEQDREFARLQHQDREQEEADNKADQGCSVTRPKDEEAIPSTHCARPRCMTSLHVTVTAVQDSGRITSTDHVGSWTMDRGRGRPEDSRAKKPSSSSLRVGAGNGAPGGSCVGSLTDPASPKGFSDCSLDRIGFCDDVLTGTSASRRDQPMEFNDSRKDVEAMATDSFGTHPPAAFSLQIIMHHNGPRRYSFVERKSDFLHTFGSESKWTNVERDDRRNLLALRRRGNARRQRKISCR
ncbi:hypothetical protein MMC07_000109 [Pseudocyphellaria aurata]|nr:hypothetical protein [Pseudocyphellaria aurata]